MKRLFLTFVFFAIIFWPSATNNAANIWRPQDKVTAPNPEAGDKAGTSVAIDGNRMVVGVPGENNDTGAAYVFRRNGDQWVQEQRLIAPQPNSPGEAFGTAVDIDGDRIAVSATGEFKGIHQGVIYIFERRIFSWFLDDDFGAFYGGAGNGFGESISLSGDFVAVGAPRFDNLGQNTGQVFIFQRLRPNTWAGGTDFSAFPVQAGRQFGSDVALDGNRLLVGARFEEVNNVNGAGSAYTYIYNGVNWSQEDEITLNTPQTNDLFGSDVDLQGNTAVIGAQGTAESFVFQRNGTDWQQQAVLDDPPRGATLAMDVALNNNRVVVGVSTGLLDTGTAFVYQRSGTNWSLQRTLNAVDGSKDDLFGESVGISGSQMVVGAPDINNDRGGAYTFTTDPPPKQGNPAEVTALDAAPIDQLGTAVDIDGNTMVVGAPDEDANGLSTAGSAYVYTRGSSGWQLVTKLIAEDPEPGASFGEAVAIDGSRIAIGAPGDGDGGAVYVFQLFFPDGWQQVNKFFADTAPFDQYGASVDISGNRVVIGAPKDDDDGSASGSAIVITINNPFSLRFKITAPDAAAGDNFGTDVAIDGGRVVVGSPGDGVTGSAYIFDPVGSNNWTQSAKLQNNFVEVGNDFGTSVALDGDTAIVGAPGDNDDGFRSGSAYVFTRNGPVWSQQARLSALDVNSLADFGSSVALDGDFALIGAEGDDDNGMNNGSTYIYERTGNTWMERAKLIAPAPDPNGDDFFGASVAVSGTTFAVGAWGVDGKFPNTGSVFVFSGVPGGTDTIGVFYPSNGSWLLRNANGSGAPSITPFTYGSGGVPVSGDWNGDGIDTVGVFYPSNGSWLLRNANGSGAPSITPFTYGSGGVPVSGDWNGDGIDTIGVFYANNGAWYLRDANGSGAPSITPFTYGKGGVPVTGDWNDDGIDTIGVFYPSTGTWFLRDANSVGAPTIPSFTYGSGGVPVTGDWNGDGIDTVGVFYPNNGAWYLRDASSPGGPSIPFFTYGKGGKAIVGDWDGTNGNAMAASLVRGIAGFALVDADTGQLVTVIEDGQTFTDLPENVQVVAEAFGGDAVTFDYQGVEGFIVDNTAPFTLTGDNPTALASGAHTLTAKLYANEIVIDHMTISFVVE